jgi:hypothetical protein
MVTIVIPGTVDACISVRTMPVPGSVPTTVRVYDAESPGVGALLVTRRSSVGVGLGGDRVHVHLAVGLNVDHMDESSKVGYPIGGQRHCDLRRRDAGAG